MNAKTKIKQNNNVEEVYILEDKTTLKNIVVSHEDPYDKLFSSAMKEEIWYSDILDY